MASPFSDLPSELHTSLKPTWIEAAKPASLLLGTNNDLSADIEEISDVFKLPDEANQALNKELATYLAERNKAINDFISSIDRRAHKLAEYSKYEAIVLDLLETQFENKCLPLTPDTLQKLVDMLVVNGYELWFSSLFTVWSDKLRKQGVDNPVLQLTWPEHVSKININFGEGMRDVQLHISGNLRGDIGRKAVNCTFILDSFEGHLGIKSTNCSFQADSIEGYIGTDATNCTFQAVSIDANPINLSKGCKIECKNLKSPNIALADGCVLIADIVEGDFRKPWNFRDVEEIPESYTIKIGHLTGSIEGAEEWDVEIDEITERPKPKRLPKSQIPGKEIISMAFKVEPKYILGIQNVIHEELKNNKKGEKYLTLSESVHDIADKNSPETIVDYQEYLESKLGKIVVESIFISNSTDESESEIDFDTDKSLILNNIALKEFIAKHEKGGKYD